ncbi:MAG TPA: EamA family transporter [Acidimicrobiia bacterium]|nr:EamA family transporter [Acidimicrobiia bacterium]
MRPRDVAATVFVTAVWGVAFVGLKEVVAHGPPVTLAGARFVLGGALLLPLLWRRAHAVAPTERRVRPLNAREVLLVALLQTTLLYGLGFLGIQRTTAGASALLLNTNPVMVALLAWPMLGERLRLSSAAGIVLAVGGVATVALGSGLGSPVGIALLLAAALAWASASIVIKRMGSVDLLRLSCLQMIVGGLPLLALGIVFEHRLPHPTPATWAWFAFLVVPATAVNFALWFRLLERYSATAMTSWLFLIPVFGVLSGAVFLDESIGWRIVVGGLLVVLGLVLTQRQASREEVVLTA